MASVDRSPAPQATYELRSVMAAISRSQAVIEFDLEGHVLTANQNFIDAMGYSLAEIVGKHHRMFCDPELAGSAEYAQFWADLGAGSFTAGEYRRLAKGGREVRHLPDKRLGRHHDQSPAVVVEPAGDRGHPAESQVRGAGEQLRPPLTGQRDQLGLPAGDGVEGHRRVQQQRDVGDDATGTHHRHGRPATLQPGPQLQLAAADHLDRRHARTRGGDDGAGVDIPDRPHPAQLRQFPRRRSPRLRSAEPALIHWPRTWRSGSPSRITRVIIPRTGIRRDVVRIPPSRRAAVRRLWHPAG